jgi:4-hydroxy-4-methyl-2-oxoglutarate aldolase
VAQKSQPILSSEIGLTKALLVALQISDSWQCGNSERFGIASLWLRNEKFHNAEQKHVRRILRRRIGHTIKFLEGSWAMTSKVYLKVDRVGPETCAAAKEVTVSDLHEALGAILAPAATMSFRMRPVNRGLRAVGPAVTAQCATGDNLMMHRALSLAQAGDVLVVQGTAMGAQWGDVAAQYAKKLGLAGVVVDGYARDIDILEQLKFPVWSTLIGPSRPEKAGHGWVNAPVICDGVRVEPGDLVAADGDGVIVIPKRLAAEVVETARQRMKREEDAARRIAAGELPWQFSGAVTNYERLQVEEFDRPWNP